MTWSQRAFSFLMRAVRASGVEGAGVKYCSASCLRTASLPMMRASSLFKRSTIGAGVPAGTSTAFHEMASKSG
ncbi:hypothetical protein D9M68_842940 [compost metagenome]